MVGVRVRGWMDTVHTCVCHDVHRSTHTTHLPHRLTFTTARSFPAPPPLPPAPPPAPIDAADARAEPPLGAVAELLLLLLLL